jgi:hypothetical protein
VLDLEVFNDENRIHKNVFSGSFKVCRAEGSQPVNNKALVNLFWIISESHTLLYQVNYVPHDTPRKRL